MAKKRRRDMRYGQRTILLSGLVASELASTMCKDDLKELAEFMALLSRDMLIIAGYDEVAVLPIVIDED